MALNVGLPPSPLGAPLASVDPVPPTPGVTNAPQAPAARVTAVKVVKPSAPKDIKALQMHLDALKPFMHMPEYPTMLKATHEAALGSRAVHPVPAPLAQVNREASIPPAMPQMAPTAPSAPPFEQAYPQLPR
jgi:hypothetical protein